MRTFKPLIFLMHIFFALSASSQSKTQYQCDTCTFVYPIIQLPEMFVDRKEAITRDAQFSEGAFLRASKLKRLSRKFNFSDNSFKYSQKTFASMLAQIESTTGYERLRIYFGAYNTLNCATDFGIKQNELILIFSAEDKDRYHIGKYFIINSSTDVLYEISDDCKENWTNNFSRVISSLNRTIKKYKSDTNNYIQENGEKKLSDTRSIVYGHDSIHHSFITEIDYQKKQHGIDIVYFKANFASYTEGGRTLPTGEITNQKRLIIQFEFLYTDSYGKLQKLDQETQCDYQCRKNIQSQTSAQVSANALSPAAAADNGQLCPSNCPK